VGISAGHTNTIAAAPTAPGAARRSARAFAGPPGGAACCEPVEPVPAVAAVELLVLAAPSGSAGAVESRKPHEVVRARSRGPGVPVSASR